MALKIARSRQIKTYIPTASMADITFMLIIFFVLTTTFTVDKTPVQLPDSLSRKEAVQESALVLVHLEYDSTGRPTRLHYRYSEGMLQSWPVGQPIDVTNDPGLDQAYYKVRAEIVPELSTYVRCTLQPDADAGNGQQCHNYMRTEVNPKYPKPGTKQWNDMIHSLGTKRFIIKADSKVPYRFVDPVIQTLRDNNAFEVFLLTEQASG